MAIKLKDPVILNPDMDSGKAKHSVRKVKGYNNGTTRAVMMVRDHVVVTDEPSSNTAPTPLETLLSSLLGCECAITHKVATAMRFDFSAIELDAVADMDMRGINGVQGVRPYFSKVELKIRIFSNEAEKKFARLVKNIEYRCPILNLFLAADVEVNIDWQLVPTD
jgi:uncharacterized OsmC-like protein